MDFEWRVISSLEKIFPESYLRVASCDGFRGLRSEILSFQIAVRTAAVRILAWEIAGDLATETTVREIKPVPSELPTDEAPDSNYLRTTPGLFPDLLLEPAGNHIKTMMGYWQSLWVSIKIPAEAKSGKHQLSFTFKSDDRPNIIQKHIEEKFTVDIVVFPFKLPKQKLLRCEWFHVDCLSKKYNVESWSEPHWDLIKKYVKDMASHGINMLYTPLWTPPLDTAVGAERPTAQLLEIEKKGNIYEFDFSRLERYIDLGLSLGCTHFEMSHAFSQWGAKFTPKIMVRIDGCEKQLFGWQVPADSEEYKEFLTQLMAQLVPFLLNKGLKDHCYFAVSDEPIEKHLESYGYAATLMRSLIKPFQTLDALSVYEFYKRGYVENPIPICDHIEDFKGKVEHLWTYYCSGGNLIPNRFMAMPSARNRILGTLFYIYRIYGFLHWGFNFWYSQFSLDQDIDVFLITDAKRAFPSGDSFMVYPGKNGPLGSIRHEVFFEGLQDLRLMELLEEKIGRNAVLKIIHAGVPYEISMRRYPTSSEWLLGLRERLLDRLQNLEQSEYV
jgi:hypothetical protein